MSLSKLGQASAKTSETRKSLVFQVGPVFVPPPLFACPGVMLLEGCQSVVAEEPSIRESPLDTYVLHVAS